MTRLTLQQWQQYLGQSIRQPLQSSPIKQLLDDQAHGIQQYRRHYYGGHQKALTDIFMATHHYMGSTLFRECIEHYLRHHHHLDQHPDINQLGAHFYRSFDRVIPNNQRTMAEAIAHFDYELQRIYYTDIEAIDWTTKIQQAMQQPDAVTVSLPKHVTCITRSADSFLYWKQHNQYVNHILFTRTIDTINLALPRTLHLLMDNCQGILSITPLSAIEHEHICIFQQGLSLQKLLDQHPDMAHQLPFYVKKNWLSFISPNKNDIKLKSTIGRPR